MKDEFDDIESPPEVTSEQLIQRFRIPDEEEPPDTEETIWLRVREKMQAQQEEQRLFTDMKDQKIRDVCRELRETQIEKSRYQAAFRISFMFSIVFFFMAFASITWIGWGPKILLWLQTLQGGQ